MQYMTKTQHQGRPKQYVKEHVIDAAMQSFWQKGYDGCSMDDLLEATHLSKSSFYQSFGNKKQVFLMTLAHYSDRENEAMQRSISEAITGYQFFENLIESIVAKTVPHWESGCLIANTASEFGQNDPQIGSALKHAIDNFVQTFASAIVKGHADGTISKDQNSEDLAHYLIVALNGLRTMSKAGMENSYIRKAGRMILKTLT
jgi:TetR/AcrR family transcriptional regulator, transcriptional repressor for nem operon